MFTGIVEAVGSIAKIERTGDLFDLEIEVGPEIASEVQVGDSIAISGCCLTVTGATRSSVSLQAIPETLRLTSLADRRPGDRVNIERALRADARLDGHIVQGHVDVTGRVSVLRRDADDVILRIECPEDFSPLLVPKGSIAIDGVSLTVVNPESGAFSVALIPHTLKETTLGDRVVGDRVNLEADVIGKYVFHYLEDRGVGRR